MCFNHESHEFSRMGSSFAGEFNNQFYSCLFAEFVAQICSSLAEWRAKGDLSVPVEEKIPAATK